jgi:hypothetical protein
MNLLPRGSLWTALVLLALGAGSALYGLAGYADFGAWRGYASETRRTERLQRLLEATRERLAVKRALVEALISGRLSLRQAIARLRARAERTADGVLPAESEEALGRSLLLWTAVRLSRAPSAEATALLTRLKGELREILDRSPADKADSQG